MQHLDDTALSQGSQQTSLQQGGSPSASQLSDSDATTHRRGGAGAGPFGQPAAQQGQEVDSRRGEVDSGAAPSAPQRGEHHSGQLQQGYTSDQSGGARRGGAGRGGAGGSRGTAVTLRAERARRHPVQSRAAPRCHCLHVRP